MVKKLMMIVLVALGGFVVFVATRPADFKIMRSATIQAPAAVVFSRVNDLHQWDAWSPWAKMDPNATNSFEGPSAGPGASMHWKGNMQVGEGTMTITESRASDYVRMRLDFVKPMKGTNQTEFTFQPNGKETQVTWAMTGRNNFIAKAVGVFMDCDKMVGGQFEAGLANLKALTERR